MAVYCSKRFSPLPYGRPNPAGMNVRLSIDLSEQRDWEESETKKTLIRTGICEKGCRFQSEWDVTVLSTKY